MSNNDISIDGSIVAVRHKIVLIGDVNVGKTSIMYRFIEEKYKDVYDKPTIGVDFYSKTINYKDKQLKLQIWDSAGQERYKSLIPSYIKGASIIFIVFDISRLETFNNVPNWINFMKDSRSEDTILVLCGNKCDLERRVQAADAEKLAKTDNLIYFEASAKNNVNIKKLFFFPLAKLSFFEQFNKTIEKISEELVEENSDTIQAESGLKLNLSQRSNTNNNALNIKDRKTDTNNKEKTQCKC